LIGELSRVGRVPGQVKSAGVPQRVLLLEVPAGAPGPGRSRGLVGVDDLRGGHHRVRARLTGYGDAVLGLRAHDPTHAHASEPSADCTAQGTPRGTRGHALRAERRPGPD